MEMLCFGHMKLMSWFSFILIMGAAYWFFFARENPNQVPAPSALPASPSSLPPTPVRPLTSPSPRMEQIAHESELPTSTPPIINSSPSNASDDTKSKFPMDRNGLLRNAEGKLVKMAEKEAEKACKEHGGHLSTIRELVTWSERLIRENFEDENKVLGRDTVDHVVAINPDGTRDEFDLFYRGNDLVAGSKPTGDLGENQFMSSSRSALDSSEVLSFNGELSYVNSGGIEPGSKGFGLGVVRCVPDKRTKN
jgi:hypothetical protein